MTTAFTVGQRVRALQTITQDADECLPAQHLCTKGDELEVREIYATSFRPVLVAHSWKPKNIGFRVELNEIEALP